MLTGKTSSFPAPKKAKERRRPSWPVISAFGSVPDFSDCTILWYACAVVRFTSRGSPVLFSVAALTLAGCTASDPLSITLYHPETKITRRCAARAASPRDVPVLAGAVEACARQLEARGFQRLDSPLEEGSEAQGSAARPTIR